MNLGQLKIFQVMNARMHWLTARQEVLSQNVANADTPGYVAHDLDPLPFEKMLRDNVRPLRMASTSESHLKGAGIADANGKTMAVKAKFEASPTGNSVVLEEEMMKVADTAADYELMTNLYKKSVGLFRIALSKGHG